MKLVRDNAGNVEYSDLHIGDMIEWYGQKIIITKDMIDENGRLKTQSQFSPNTLLEGEQIWIKN